MKSLRASKDAGQQWPNSEITREKRVNLLLLVLVTNLLLAFPPSSHVAIKSL